MTDVEKMAYELEKLYCTTTEECTLNQPEKCTCWQVMATHVQRKILEARIEEMNKFTDLLGNAEGWGSRFDKRMNMLTTKLKELEG